MIDTIIFLFGLSAFFLLLVYIIKTDLEKNSKKKYNSFFSIRDDEDFYEKYKDTKPF